MGHAVTRLAVVHRSARRRSEGVALNWRLVLMLGVNVGLWSAIILGVRAALD